MKTKTTLACAVAISATVVCWVGWGGDSESSLLPPSDEALMEPKGGEPKVTVRRQTALVATMGQERRIEHDNPTPSSEPALLVDEEASPKVLSLHDERMQYSSGRLKTLLEEFRAGPSLSSGYGLMEIAAIAWSDFSGASHSMPSGGSFTLGTRTREEWTVFVSDSHGMRQVPVYQSEIPEYWEMIEAEKATSRPILDDSISEDLLARLESRASTILKLVSE